MTRHTRSLALVAVALAASVAFAPPPAGRPPPRPPARPTPRPPEAIRTEFNRFLREQPHEAFDFLRREASDLNPADRARMARQIAADLAGRVQSEPVTAATLHQLRQASSQVAEIAPEAKAELRALARLARGRMLAGAVAEVNKPLAAEKYGDAARAAAAGHAALKQSPPPAAEEDDEDPLWADILAALDAAARPGRLLAALDAAARLLAALSPDKPLAEDALDVDARTVPADLGPHFVGLMALANLRLVAANPDNLFRVGEAETLGGQLPAFRAVVKELLGKDFAESGVMLRQDVAVVALLRDNRPLYEFLWPEIPNKAHAAHLAADLRALALGKGTVNTWPAGEYVKRLGDDPKPPEALAGLLSHDDRSHWRPPQAKRDEKVPQPIEEARELGRQIHTAATTKLKEQTAAAEKEAAPAFEAFRKAEKLLKDRDEADRKLLADVETAMKRPLMPVEKAHALALGRKKTPAEDIVAALKKMGSEEP